MKIPKKYLDLYERDQLLGINKCTKEDLLLTWDEYSYTFKHKDQILLHKPRNQEEEILVRKFIDIYSELFEGINIKGQTFKLEYPYLHISHPLVSEKVLLDGFFISKVMKIAGNAGLDILADKLALPYPIDPKVIDLLDWGYLKIGKDNSVLSYGLELSRHSSIRYARYSIALLLFSRYSKLFTHNDYPGLVLSYWDRDKDVKTNLRNLARIEMEQATGSKNPISLEFLSIYNSLVSLYKDPSS